MPEQWLAFHTFLIPNQEWVDRLALEEKCLSGWYNELVKEQWFDGYQFWRSLHIFLWFDLNRMSWIRSNCESSHLKTSLLRQNHVFQPTILIRKQILDNFFFFLKSSVSKFFFNHQIQQALLCESYMIEVWSHWFMIKYPPGKWINRNFDVSDGLTSTDSVHHSL